MKERILVIKLGALGDLVLCAGAFAAIRAHHPDAEIALLTGPAFASFGLSMPWFDAVILDPRPKINQPLAWWRLIRSVRNFAPTMVYDFQGKTRQTILYYALGKPTWSGAVKGCSLPRPWPPEKGMHYTDFLAAQLEKAGVETKDFFATLQSRHSGDIFSSPSGERKWNPESRLVCADEEKKPDSGLNFLSTQEERRRESFSGMTVPLNLSWLDGDVSSFNLPEKFAVIITSCSPQHPHKMWSPLSFAALADRLKEKGMSVLAIGTKTDQLTVETVRTFAPHVIDLCGQTSLGQVAALARRAQLVVGNDTGPTHIAAAVGAKTIALMSEKVDPLWSSPRGPNATWVGGKSLAEVSVDEVLPL